MKKKNKNQTVFSLFQKKKTKKTMMKKFRSIGLMSGSSLDGLDVVCVDFSTSASAISDDDRWSFQIVHAETLSYSSDWVERLSTATKLDAHAYLLLHSAYGHFLGELVRQSLVRADLSLETIDLIVSHGHTTFHEPSNRMTAQLGDGAAIASELGRPVLSDLRAMDVALGGQGAPIVPIGEKFLFRQFRLLLNLGGIANLTEQSDGIAFDICPANRVLNQLTKEFFNEEFDRDGQYASKGQLNTNLFEQLNQFDYYRKLYPKSLANSFGLETIYPLLIATTNLSIFDRLRTFVEHVVHQICQSIEMILVEKQRNREDYRRCQMLVTGGGAHNRFLIERLRDELKKNFQIELILPSNDVIDFKEALIMAFIGVLRLENKANVLSSVTGAKRDSIGGAFWSN